MKQTLRWFTLTTLLLISVGVSAQERLKNTTPEERANKLTEWMKQNLQLNDNQVSQIQAINLKYAQQNEHMKDATKSKDDKMKAMKETEQARDAELKGILTAEQFKKWQAKKSETKDMAKHKMKDKNGH